MMKSKRFAFSSIINVCCAGRGEAGCAGSTTFHFSSLRKSIETSAGRVLGSLCCKMVDIFLET